MKDVEFFRRAGLMDYSLLVIKINLVGFATSQNLSIEDVIKIYYPKKFHCIPSIIEIGIYYAIGIIDYL